MPTRCSRASLRTASGGQGPSALCCRARSPVSQLSASAHNQWNFELHIFVPPALSLRCPRDCAEEIRATAIEGIGGWVRLHPGAFLTDQVCMQVDGQCGRCCTGREERGQAPVWARTFVLQLGASG